MGDLTRWSLVFGLWSLAPMANGQWLMANV
jgi:hypothetical protein